MTGNCVMRRPALEEFSMTYPTLAARALACTRRANSSRIQTLNEPGSRGCRLLRARCCLNQHDVYSQEQSSSAKSSKLRRQHGAGPRQREDEPIRRITDTQLTSLESERVVANMHVDESYENLLPHPIELEYGQVRFDEEFAARNRVLPCGERITRVAAEILIPAHANVVWTILTDIDLVSLISPELARNEIMYKTEDFWAMKQVGLIQSVYWQLGKRPELGFYYFLFLPFSFRRRILLL